MIGDINSYNVSITSLSKCLFSFNKTFHFWWKYTINSRLIMFKTCVERMLMNYLITGRVLTTALVSGNQQRDLDFVHFDFDFFHCLLI